MTTNGPTFDVERLAQAWARAYPGLVGRDAPLIGVHLVEDARSPQRGAIATIAVGSPRTVDMEGLGDSAPIAWTVRAIGGEDGAKGQAQRGASALASALRTLDGTPVLVTANGVTAQLSSADSVQGPTWVGAPQGQATYRIDATMVWQRVAGA